MKSSLQHGALALGTAAFPQFAGAIHSGYAAFKTIQRARQLSREYEIMEGPPEEKLARLAAKEGFGLLVGEVIGKRLDQPADETIDKAVHTAADVMSREHVFTEITKKLGLPDASSDDLRYFFVNTSEHVLKSAYAGVKDDVTDYILRGAL
jgi:hypothetical protein